MKNLLFYPLLLIVFIACEEDGKFEVENSEVAMKQEVSMGYAMANNESYAQSLVKQSDVMDIRKVIWNANLEFQVTNVDEATNNIKAIAHKYNAFVSNMHLTSSNTLISNTITLRVKSGKFDSLISSIKGQSIYMKNIKINSKDVTEEFVDINSRLKTKKDVRERYISILRNKTGDVKDVIAAEDAIREITEEIEAKEGRYRYLQDQVNFSTIELRVYQEVEFTKEPTVYIKPYSEKLLDGLSNGWAMITGIFLGLVNIWPLVLLVTLTIWKRKWIVSKFKN